MPKLIKRGESVVIVDEWGVDDVQDMRPDLTDEQCEKVLELMVEQYDANYGINWDVIHYACDELYPESNEE